MVACEGRMNRGLRRQIGGGVANRLDARLLVIEDDCDITCRGSRGAQNRDLGIDAENLGYFRLECFVTPFQIVAHLVWFDVSGGETLADRLLYHAGQARISSFHRVLTHMTRQ